VAPGARDGPWDRARRRQGRPGQAWGQWTAKASIAEGKLVRPRIGSSKTMRRPARKYLKASSKHKLTVIMKVVAVAKDGTQGHAVGERAGADARGTPSAGARDCRQ
jgi:hypothetical protein